MQTHSKLLTAVSVLGLLCLGPACSTTPDDAGEGTVLVTAEAITVGGPATPAQVDHITLTATPATAVNDTLTPQHLVSGGVVISTRLSKATASGHGHWVGSLTGLRVGDWQFHAAAYPTSADTGAIYATDVSGGADTFAYVSSGNTAAVALELMESNSSHPFSNSAPIISGLFTSAIDVAPGAHVAFSVVASDPNPSDTLTYAWTKDGDPFTGSTSSNGWDVAADATDGDHTIAVTVTDNHGAASGLSIVVHIRAEQFRGSQPVVASINTFPRVTSVSAGKSQVGLGDVTNLDVAATDDDGDTGFAYSWSIGGNGCLGYFDEVHDGAFSATTSSKKSPYVKLTAAGGSECTVTVTVDDQVTPYSGHNTGTLTLHVGVGTGDAAPVVDSTYQDVDNVDVGGSGELHVFAHDPDGDTVTITWSDDVGALTGSALTPTSPSTAASKLVWSNTACSSGVTTITAHVTATHGSLTAQTTDVPFSFVCHAGPPASPITFSGFTSTPTAQLFGPFDTFLLSVTASTTDGSVDAIVLSAADTTTPANSAGSLVHVVDNNAVLDGVADLTPGSDGAATGTIYWADLPGCLPGDTITFTATATLQDGRTKTSDVGALTCPGPLAFGALTITSVATDIWSLKETSLTFKGGSQAGHSAVAQIGSLTFRAIDRTNAASFPGHIEVANASVQNNLVVWEAFDPNNSSLRCTAGDTIAFQVIATLNSGGIQTSDDVGTIVCPAPEAPVTFGALGQSPDVHGSIGLNLTATTTEGSISTLTFDATDADDANASVGFLSTFAQEPGDDPGSMMSAGTWAPFVPFGPPVTPCTPSHTIAFTATATLADGRTKTSDVLGTTVCPVID